MENHCRVLKDKMNVSKADRILNLRKSMNLFLFAWTDIKFQTLIWEDSGHCGGFCDSVSYHKKNINFTPTSHLLILAHWLNLTLRNFD